LGNAPAFDVLQLAKNEGVEYRKTLRSFLLVNLWVCLELWRLAKRCENYYRAFRIVRKTASPVNQ
jgi:hypothetical protein